MRTRLECIPCLMRQAAGLAGENLPERMQEPFIRRVLEDLVRFDFAGPPPMFTRGIYRLLKDMDGNDDPFEAQKALFNRQALMLYPGLKQLVESRPDPLEAALRIAVAGNVIDFGIHDPSGIAIEQTIANALNSTFAVNRIPALVEELESAQSVLYLADNAGEIVLDRLFIERIGPGRVTCALRSAPVINDATVADAIQAGLDKICRVVPSGSDAPGTPLELCSEEFRGLFRSADVVISKGQGNFETLDAPGRGVFHLMMAKCPVVAREVGVPLGSFIVAKKC
ncbi:MAG TPA: ARMT1-like domain-containing protein [Deltaproteobacteria bacterium]|nr:ARMT1-like domain-containing protein [Deltaproteobacteria bacterium]